MTEISSGDPGRSLSRACIACAAGLIVFLGIAVVGHAAGKATGALLYKGCVTEDTGCGAGNDGIVGLDGATDVAVSADGKSVYVASNASSAIAAFKRNPQTSLLDYKGCVTEDTGCGAGNDGIVGLAGASGVAVSGDGKSVYAASRSSSAIAEFKRDPQTGLLKYKGCITQEAGCGAGNDGIIGLAEAAGVAVSGDGKSVYVASHDSDGIAEFKRDPQTSLLKYKGCITQGTGCGAGNDGIVGLDGAESVAVSADGKSVYVAAHDSDAIAGFKRDPQTSLLDYKGCATGQTGCGAGNDGVVGLDGAESVAVSADGKSVYVASILGSAIAEFKRNPQNGLLDYKGCVTYDSGCGAGNDGIHGLSGALTVAVSADGKNVYVASYVGDAIAAFKRNPQTSLLAYKGCVTQGGGCGAGNDGIFGLDGAEGVAVSGDGKSVYVASSNPSNAIAEFKRQ